MEVVSGGDGGAGAKSCGSESLEAWGYFAILFLVKTRNPEISKSSVHYLLSCRKVVSRVMMQTWVTLGARFWGAQASEEGEEEELQRWVASAPKFPS